MLLVYSQVILDSNYYGTRVYKFTPSPFQTLATKKIKNKKNKRKKVKPKHYG